MFDIKRLLLRIPNFLTKEECLFLINEHKKQIHLGTKEISADAIDGKWKEATFTAVSALPQTTAFNFLKDKTKKAVKIYTEYLNSSNYFHKLISESVNFSHDYRILEYKKGAQIHPHIDHDPFVNGSITMNLNDNYEGGEFGFFNNNWKLKLKQGEVIIFPANYFWVHQVNKITQGTRYSINSFLTSLPIKIIDETLNYSEKIMNEYMNTTPKSEILGPYDR